MLARSGLGTGAVPRRGVRRAVGLRGAGHLHENGMGRDRVPVIKSLGVGGCVADELGARTVAFPAVSAGIYGWPMDDAARIAVQAVRETDTAVEEVIFVLFGERAYEAFARQVR
ncbi:macro domain-containing protein [Streptomyces sp. PSKA30]|uniref:macro domain-containing protein n=1 Tax=Streptomyces sp. PSKA30 TaxID=2874597 RepID=UPI001CD0EA12|nr:macro domain-containing protein [Streptomyces sp. PSKA30]MBZ9642939.1 macro domain-containing protein [Streptomyces sp. PSKA30]